MDFLYFSSSAFIKSLRVDYFLWYYLRHGLLIAQRHS